MIKPGQYGLVKHNRGERLYLYIGEWNILERRALVLDINDPDGPAIVFFFSDLEFIRKFNKKERAMFVALQLASI